MRTLGLWRDSRAVYALGAFFAGMIGSAAAGAFMWRSSLGEIVFYAIIPGPIVGILLVIAGLVGFHMTSGNPDLGPVWRWLALCFFAGLVLSIITVIGSVHRFSDGLWLTGPMAAIHGVWTALFLIGRRTSGR
jgi:hypothetical protein